MTTTTGHILPAGTSCFSAVVNGKPTGLAGCDNAECPKRGACLRADTSLPRVSHQTDNDLHEPYPAGLPECKNFILRAAKCPTCPHGLGFNCRTCWPAR